MQNDQGGRDGDINKERQCDKQQTPKNPVPVEQQIETCEKAGRKTNQCDTSCLCDEDRNRESFTPVDDAGADVIEQRSPEEMMADSIRPGDILYVLAEDARGWFYYKLECGTRHMDTFTAMSPIGLRVFCVEELGIRIFLTEEALLENLRMSGREADRLSIMPATQEIAALSIIRRLDSLSLLPQYAVGKTVWVTKLKGKRLAKPRAYMVEQLSTWQSAGTDTEVELILGYRNGDEKLVVTETAFGDYVFSSLDDALKKNTSNRKRCK